MPEMNTRATSNPNHSQLAQPLRAKQSGSALSAAMNTLAKICQMTSSALSVSMARMILRRLSDKLNN